MLLVGVRRAHRALLFMLAVMPALVERVDAAFAGAEPSDGRWRFHGRSGGDDRGRHSPSPRGGAAVALVAVVGLARGSGRAPPGRLTGGALSSAPRCCCPCPDDREPGWRRYGGPGIGQLDPAEGHPRSRSAPRRATGHRRAFASGGRVLLGLALAGGELVPAAGRSRRCHGRGGLSSSVLAIGCGLLPDWASGAPAHAVLAAASAWPSWSATAAAPRSEAIGASLRSRFQRIGTLPDRRALSWALVASDGGDGRGLGDRRLRQGPGLVCAGRLRQRLLQRGCGSAR